MISIEDKMALFTKLVVNQLEDKYNKRVAELEKANAEEIHKREADIEERGRALYDQYVDSAAIEKKIRLSRVRSECKKNRLKKQQELTEHLVDEVVNKARHFVKSDDYQLYIDKLVSQHQDSIEKYDAFFVYLTKRDYDHLEQFFIECFEKHGFSKSRFKFKVSNRDIIGGIAIVQKEKLRQIDLTLRARIDENKNTMGSAVYQMLKEAGEVNGNS